MSVPIPHAERLAVHIANISKAMTHIERSDEISLAGALWRIALAIAVFVACIYARSLV